MTEAEREAGKRLVEGWRIAGPVLEAEREQSIRDTDTVAAAAADFRTD